jgi:predicted ABC-type ATPase
MNFLTRTKLWLNNQKLPVYWGNRHWYDHENKIKFSGGLTRLNPNWIDYRKLPDQETAKLLQDSHPQSPYRQRFHVELIEEILRSITPVDKKERVCLFTSGGTASGKTSAVDELVGKSISINVQGGIRIDYDRLKKLLPEYDHMISVGILEAAKYVQSESSKLGAKVFKKSFAKGAPIIFEQTLENSKMPLEYIKNLRKKGYEVIVAATHVTEAIGQARALERAGRSGRHVPPDVISKIYAAVPAALFEIRQDVDQLFLFDNNGTKLEMIFSRDKKNGSQIINQSLYTEYLRYVGSNWDLSL